MLARAFALVRGKGTQCPPLNRFVQSSGALRRRFHTPPQQFYRRSSLSDCASQEQQPPQNYSTGTPPACSTMQNNSSAKENAADSCLEPTANDDTAEVNFDQRFAILSSIGECTNEDDLRTLLKKKTTPVCYVWCDPSPSMHITQGITMAINVNKLLEAGCKVKIFMANWFALTSYNVSLRKVINVFSYNTEMWRTACMRLDEGPIWIMGLELVWVSWRLK
uniref:tyrosine--tRNA ligase n=1 Tax=Triticum urartu TaxID=4572 RepID=A0A8R7V909_TRIUA